MSIFDPLLDLVFPRFCYGCGKFGTNLCQSCAKKHVKLYPMPICPGCMASISSIGVHPKCKKDTALAGLIVVGEFTGVYKQMIAEAKYKGYFDLYHTHSLLFPVTVIKRLHPRCITPIPISRKKHRERGFNQSEILAHDLSRLCGVPMIDKLLYKTKDTRAQAELSRKERLKNVTGSFTCPHKLKKSDVIILVDDVVTTGSTFSECAKVLKRAGAGTVFGVALAHGH